MRPFYRVFTVFSQLLILVVLTANTVMAQADFWEPTNGPFRGSISSIAINSNDDILVGSFGWGVYRSSDNGDTWNQFISGLPAAGFVPNMTRGDIRAFAISSNGDIFAGIEGLLSEDNGGLFRSTDNGENWSQIGTGLPNGSISALAINSNNVLFAGTSNPAGPVFRSSDNGDTWHQTSTGLTGLGNTSVRVLAINSNDDIFAAISNPFLFRSTNNGDNWTQISLPSGGIGELAINSNDVLFAPGSGGVMRSADNGETWSEIIGGLTASGCCKLAINSENDIFAGTNSGTSNGVPFFARAFLSRDNGDNWMEISSGLDSTSIFSLAFNSNDVLFAGLGDGFVLRSVGTTTAVEEIFSSIPSSFALEQNYPNPFNPTTTIQFSLAKGATVKLTIYNLTGQKIVTLVNKEHQPGTYSVQWDGKDESGSIVASGVYTYRLEAPERIETRKLVLIR